MKKFPDDYLTPAVVAFGLGFVLGVATLAWIYTNTP